MLETKYYAEGLERKQEDYCRDVYVAIIGYEHYNLRINVSLARVRLALGFAFGHEYTKAEWLNACSILANYKKKTI